MVWYMVWPGEHVMAYGMAWRASNGVWYGCAGMAQSMAWRAGQGIWYDLTGIVYHAW